MTKHNNTNQWANKLIMKVMERFFVLGKPVTAPYGLCAI